MTPAARLQAAIEILAGMNSTARPRTAICAIGFASRRFAGVEGSRRGRGARLRGAAPSRASLAWRMGSKDARALVLASLLAEKARRGRDCTLFSVTGHGPPPLTDAERSALNASQRASRRPCPRRVSAWLEPELLRDVRRRTFKMRCRRCTGAPRSILRVNTLRAAARRYASGTALARRSTHEAHAVLARMDSVSRPLKVWVLFSTRSSFRPARSSSRTKLRRSSTLLCAAKPGQTRARSRGRCGRQVAGARGADATTGARSSPSTSSDRRLKQLRPRARRAGATIITASRTSGAGRHGAKASSTLCWSMRRAAARAPGVAIRSRNGG